MFKLNGNNEVDQRILKCVIIRHSHAETSTINTPNSQMYNNIHKEDSVISLLNSCLQTNFEVIRKTDNSKYAKGNEVKLVNLVAFALIINLKLAASSGKHLEDINHATIGCLLYKLLTLSRGSDDLSIGFVRDRRRRQQDLPIIINIKGEYHVRFMLEDGFGLAESQEKATYG